MATIAARSQPSYYYVLIARTCIARSRSATPVRAQALREAAHHYIAKSRSSEPTAEPLRTGR
jgi:hypothetical protein